ncbi:hypothetical protein AVEN_154075-1 [Araneus ventricosus]|uniref:Uncharacterized protein n=1 Tax=Araneus ventricosus TaxID=182803 RepID=A0A4Y1ZK07_ARAVE|nr:hypothetical protein AVEN_29313-1 [Araneus ventricosus]GBL54111.1 hypothetical protein AVEN_154075-1 [Araneus ventricosus]
MSSKQAGGLSAESIARHHVLGAVEGELRGLEQEPRDPGTAVTAGLQRAEEDVPAGEEEAHRIADEDEDQKPHDGEQALAHLDFCRREINLRSDANSVIICLKLKCIVDGISFEA